MTERGHSCSTFSPVPGTGRCSFRGSCCEQGHDSGSGGGTKLLLHLPSRGSALMREDRGPLVPDPGTLSFRNNFAGGQSQPVPGTESEQPVPAPLPSLGLTGRIWGQLASRVRKVQKGEGTPALPGWVPVGKRFRIGLSVPTSADSLLASPVARTLGHLVGCGTDVASPTRSGPNCCVVLGSLLGLLPAPLLQLGARYLRERPWRARQPQGHSRILCP